MKLEEFIKSYYLYTTTISITENEYLDQFDYLEDTIKHREVDYDDYVKEAYKDLLYDTIFNSSAIEKQLINDLSEYSVNSPEYKSIIEFSNKCKKMGINMEKFDEINDEMLIDKYINRIVRKELDINEILSNIPKTIREYIDVPIDDIKSNKKRKNYCCASENDLVYADNEVCYYDCHDGDYVYIDTKEAMAFNEDELSYLNDGTLYVNTLSENCIYVDSNKVILKDIINKYNSYDCIKNNCYISDYFEDIILKEKKNRYDDLKLLKQCVDFNKLKDNLTDVILKDLEKGLEDFTFYEQLYDDGEIDIIGNYIDKNGNGYLIDWYEGMITTDEYLEYLSETLSESKNM